MNRREQLIAEIRGEKQLMKVHLCFDHYHEDQDGPISELPKDAKRYRDGKDGREYHFNGKWVSFDELQAIHDGLLRLPILLSRRASDARKSNHDE